MPNPFKAPEGSSARYTATLLDHQTLPLSGNTLTSLHLTLYDKSSNTIINSRDHQGVLNANGVTVNSTGGLVWTLTPNDNVMLSNTAAVETHIALFEWAWPTGAGKQEVLIQVQNIRRI
mgnify:CR=1